MKLVEKQFELGEYGRAEVSVDSMLVLEALVAARVDIVLELKRIAAATKTPLDDKIVEGLENFLTAANAVMAIGKE